MSLARSNQLARGGWCPLKRRFMLVFSRYPDQSLAPLQSPLSPSSSSLNLNGAPSQDGG
jgi:hypothetical protein